MAKGRKTGGRKKGSANKITTDLRAAILGAYDAAGGQAYLAKIAADHPQVFCTLLGKIIPTQVSGIDDGPIPLDVALSPGLHALVESALASVATGPK